MHVWTAPMDPLSTLSLRLHAASAASATAAVSCDEAALVADARALLSSRFDVKMGAVLPGSSAQVGFQYVKTADALLAAQAIAHDDFSRAASQFRRIISHQGPSGVLPLIVYGPSVDTTSRWIDSDLTFFPGPAFWHANATDSVASENESLRTSSVAAPPIAADVAWQMYRLSPYETAMGVVGHSTEAVAFLCDVYAPLRKLHTNLFRNRRDSNATALLTVQHPWETFSPFSAHWKEPLAKLKTRPGYDAFVKEIPASAKNRFTKGAVFEATRGDASVQDFYEPMMFLGSCLSKPNASSAACALSVHDIEFNALALRSASALVDIGRVLLERSSTCPDFDLGWKELQSDVEVVRAQAMALRDAITGNDTTPSRLWNATTQFFNDDDENHSSPSLRGLLPALAVRLPEQQLMGILSHFLPSSDAFQFLCSHYPTAYFPCGTAPADHAVTLLPYNYYLQRAFTMNEFGGLGTYVRNMTRDMVCASLTTTTNNGTDSVALAFRSDSAQPIATFEDGFTGSSLAAALLLNILLPAVNAPPSPDTPPVDHRMLTVIMCVELVVAFGVALSCVFLSVYFVANRPREKRSTRASTTETTRSKRRTRESRLDGSENLSGGLSSSNGESQSSFGSSMDLEEGLLSEEEDQAYGSFNRQRGAAAGATSPGGRWQVVREALASISPW